MSTPEQNDPKIWLVWSNEHVRWWAPKQRGYVGNIEKAGRYTEAKADCHCDSGGVEHFGKYTPNEVKVLAPEAAATLTAENARLRESLKRVDWLVDAGIGTRDGQELIKDALKAALAPQEGQSDE